MWNDENVTRDEREGRAERDGRSEASEEVRSRRGTRFTPYQKAVMEGWLDKNPDERPQQEAQAELMKITGLDNGQIHRYIYHARCRRWPSVHKRSGGSKVRSDGRSKRRTG